MQIVETNIEELSKMLGEEYAQYESRIIKLESTLSRIKIATEKILTDVSNLNMKKFLTKNTSIKTP